MKKVLLITLIALFIVGCSSDDTFYDTVDNNITQFEKVDDINSKRGGDKEYECRNVNQYGDIFSIYYLNGRFYQEVTRYGKASSSTILPEITDVDVECSTLPGIPISQ